MSDRSNIPSPQYSLIEALSTCLALAQRALAEVRSLKDYIDQCVAAKVGAALGAAKATSPDGGRTLRWQFGSNVVDVKTAIVLDAGVWKNGIAYSQGDGVTWAGSFWIAQADTSAKPGDGSEDWRLAVKRGRDGKDGKGEPGPPGPRGERGEQGQRGFAV